MYSVLSQQDRNLLLEFIDSCHAVGCAPYFGERTYPKLRELLPHQGFAFGRLNLRTSLLYQYVNLGLPAEYLNLSATPQGNIDCPILRRWSAYQKPLYYDRLAGSNISANKKKRLEASIDLGIHNMAVHGVVDSTRTTATCYTFSQMQDRWDLRSVTLLRLITPHLHAVLDPQKQPLLSEKSPAKLLTPRERDVLQWLSYGRSSSEIAMLLEIAPYTVNTHIQNIMRKLDATNRVHAVAQGLRAGVIGL